MLLLHRFYHVKTLLDILYNEIQNYWLTFKTKEQRPLYLLGVKMSIIYDARCELFKVEIIHCACINRQAHYMESAASQAPLILFPGFNIDFNKQGKIF